MSNHVPPEDNNHKQELFLEQKKRLAAYQNRISAGRYHSVILRPDGIAVTVGKYDNGTLGVASWRNVVAISAGEWLTAGLTKNGSVVAAGNFDPDTEPALQDLLDGRGGINDAVSDWNSITAISAGRNHIVGLKEDGTVVAEGINDKGQCNVSGWYDIVEVSAGFGRTIGLKSDGTVVSAGFNESDRQIISGLHGVSAVSVKTNVWFYAEGWKYISKGKINQFSGDLAARWKDVVMVSDGNGFAVGLKADGTAVAVGPNKYEECDVFDWCDIVAVSAGYTHTLGLKADGSVVATGSNQHYQCEVSEEQRVKRWKDQGACKYCGGQLKETIYFKCKSCGKKYVSPW